MKSMVLRRILTAILMGLTLCLGAGAASAQVELEIDPIAFALKGHSFHAAYSFDESRFDVGVFALELPEDSDNKDFTAFFKGHGIKWDYFGSSVDGGFWGVQASTARVRFEYDAEDDGIENSIAFRRVNNYGLRVGWRFGDDGFYLTPWISVDFNELLGDDVVLSDQKYKFNEVSFFPTVHIGYAF